MADFTPFANTLAYAIGNLLFGQLVQITGKFISSLGTGATQRENLAQALDEWNYTQLFTRLSQQLGNQQVEVRDASSETGGSSIRTHTGNSGSITESTGLPGNAALAVKLGTPQRGRSYRGRQFLPGIPTSALVSGDADSVTATFITNVLSEYADLVTSLETLDAGGNLAVGSAWHNGVKRVNGVVTPITYFTINNQMDSQRKRLKGRGT